ncbi:MAG: chemotaxis protein CheX [Actinomycetota bacterium]|nr:chemotaxis protein CheX [Actinomycetota bacterium]
MSLQLLDDDLAGLGDAIWTSILGTPALPSCDPAPTGLRSVTACVHISGSWDGTVSVSLPWGLAEEVAATMFGLPAAELTTAEVLDAVGELANIAGGNVKGMVDGASDLSLPVVSEGTGNVSVPGSRVSAKAELSHAGTTFVMQIHERA